MEDLQQSSGLLSTSQWGSKEAKTGSLGSPIFNDEILSNPRVGGIPTPKRRRQNLGRNVYPVRKTFAVIEVPLLMSTEDGGLLSMKRQSSISVSSTVPFQQSSPWSMNWEASTRMRGRTGYATGSTGLSYTFSSGGRFLVGLSTDKASARVRLGGTWNHPTFAPRWKLGAGLYKQLPMSSHLQRKDNWWHLNVSSSYDIDPRLCINTVCTVQEPRKGSYLPKIQLGLISKTVHRWNAILGWNPALRSQPLSLSVSLNPRPLFSATSRQYFNLNASCSGPTLRDWDWSATFTQSADTSQGKQRSNSNGGSTSVSVGLSHGKNFLSKGLVWMFYWTQGDFTLKVPIELAVFQTEGASIAWMYPLQILYVSFLSKIVQEIVLDVMRMATGKSNIEPTKGGPSMQLTSRREKTKEEAARQQEFMERHATNRMKSEQKLHGGLVIRNAVYYLETETDFVWNVTTPLRFWVTDSILNLPSGSKRNMLGFYSIAETEAHPDSSFVSDQATTARGPWDWLLGFWKLPPKTPDREKANPPKLWIQYEHKGKRYEVTVLDDEELVLPSSQAVIVPVKIPNPEFEN